MAPRNDGVLPTTTVLPGPRSPRPRMVARMPWSCPMVLRVWVTLSFAFMVRSSALSSLRRSRLLQVCRRLAVDEVFGLLAALAGELLEASQRLERHHGGAHDVVRIRAPEALREDVVDPRALDDGAHRAARDDTRSLRCRLEE